MDENKIMNFHEKVKLLNLAIIIKNLLLQTKRDSKVEFGDNELGNIDVHLRLIIKGNNSDGTLIQNINAS